MKKYDDFEPIPYTEKVLDENGEEVPNFRSSRLVSCYWDYYREYKNGQEALPINEALDEIFSTGSKEHYEDETLNEGARCIIDIENRALGGGMKLKHKSGKFTLTGHLDYKKFDLVDGIYYEDLKTCKKESFFYFVKCIDEGLSDDYKYQLGEYAYFDSHYTGYYIDRGVITRIMKRPFGAEDTRIVRMSIEDKLPSYEEMRTFILKHPVILCVMGLIPERKLIELCEIQMKDQSWKCMNCQYANNSSECPIYAVVNK